MHFLGVAGGIRRYADAGGAPYLLGLQPLHEFITAAAFITGAAQLIFFWNFFRSLRSGERATANPWNATTLEWITSSPPPPDNFGREFPCVYRGPYEYSVPGEASDFLPQRFRRKPVAPQSVRLHRGRDSRSASIVRACSCCWRVRRCSSLALVSAEIVRRGFSSDWQTLRLPWRVLALSTAILIASSYTLSRSRSRLYAGDEAGFRHWWLVTATLGAFFLAGNRHRMAPN